MPAQQCPSPVVGWSIHEMARDSKWFQNMPFRTATIDKVLWLSMARPSGVLPRRRWSVHGMGRDSKWFQNMPFQTVTIDQKVLWLSMAKAKHMRFSGGRLWNVAKRNCENKGANDRSKGFFNGFKLYGSVLDCCRRIEFLGSVVAWILDGIKWMIYSFFWGIRVFSTVVSTSSPNHPCPCKQQKQPYILIITDSTHCSYHELAPSSLRFSSNLSQPYAGNSAWSQLLRMRKSSFFKKETMTGREKRLCWP